METCYVCLESMDIEKLAPYVCHKNMGNGIEYRHFWHGAPGYRPYYQNRGEAQLREGELYRSPYCAPEVLSGAKFILDAIEADPEPNPYY